MGADIYRVKNSETDNPNRLNSYPHRMIPPTVQTVVPVQRLGQRAAPSGASAVEVVDMPPVNVRPCQAIRIDNYLLFRGPIFIRHGGQIPDYAGRLNVAIQNIGAVTLWIYTAFDATKAAAVAPLGRQLLSGEEISWNLAEDQELYADNLASAMTCSVCVTQLMKER